MSPTTFVKGAVLAAVLDLLKSFRPVIAWWSDEFSTPMQQGDLVVWGDEIAAVERVIFDTVFEDVRAVIALVDDTEIAVPTAELSLMQYAF